MTAPPAAPSASRQVVDQVGDVLQADRQPDRAVGDAELRPLLGADRAYASWSPGWVTSDFASPRLLEMSIEPQRVHEAERGVLAALAVEGDHACRRADICSHARASAADGRRGTGSSTRATSACRSARKSATAAALRHIASTRRRSVSSPLSSTQALNGRQRRAGVADEGLQHLLDPLLRGRGRRRRAPGPGRRCAWCRNRRRYRRRTPAASAAAAWRRRCPPRRCAPAAWARSATAARSTISSIGFDGVSAAPAWPASTSAARHCARSPPSTNSLSMP